jgi:hypothetical protein
LTKDSVDSLVTLQERMVNLINQLNMPLVEVSIVIQNLLSPMIDSLNEHIAVSGNTYGDKVLQAWPIDLSEDVESAGNFDVAKVLKVIDEDRMDILSTLIRVTLVEEGLDLADGISALRMWEHLARTQLATIKSPGQLFSPIQIPEDW